MKAIVCGLLVIMSLVLAGCGGSSDGLNLTGRLTLTTVKLGNDPYTVTATAVYSHPTKDTQGVEINYVINIYDATGPLYQFAGKANQGAGGISFITPKIFSSTRPIFVDITVNTGDLRQFSSVTIDAHASLSAVPASVDLTVVPVGTVVPVAISGGGGTAYSIVGTVPAGLIASISGATLSVSRTSIVNTVDIITIQSDTSLDVLDISVAY